MSEDDKAQPYVREPRRGESYDDYLTTCMDALDDGRRTERARREICNRQWRERNLMPRKEVVDNFLELLRKRAEVARLKLLLKRRWDESQVNRHPAGVSEGGRFASAGATSVLRAPKKPAAKPAKPTAKPTGKPAKTKPGITIPPVPTMSPAFSTKVGSTYQAMPTWVQDSLSKHGVQLRTGATLATMDASLAETPGVYITFENGEKLIGVAEYTYNFDKNKWDSAASEAEQVTWHEAGHALDQSFGADMDIPTMSSMPEFLDAWNEDIEEMDEADRWTIQYFIGFDGGEKEAFAELFMNIVGGKVRTGGRDLRPLFPRLTKGLNAAFAAAAETSNPLRPIPGVGPAGISPTSSIGF